MGKFEEGTKWLGIIVALTGTILTITNFLSGGAGPLAQNIAITLILIGFAIIICYLGEKKRESLYDARGVPHKTPYPFWNKLGLYLIFAFWIAFILWRIASPSKFDPIPTQTSLSTSIAQTPDGVSQTQEQSFGETLIAWVETQTVVASDRNPTKSPQPTAVPTITIPTPFALSPTSTSASQPTRIDPPIATNIPPTSTDIPPSNTPLPTATNTPLLSFNSLPSAQGWIYLTGSTGIPDTNVFYVDGSQLYMNTMGRGDSGFAYILYTPIDHEIPFTLIVSARVANYGDQTNENPWGFSLSVFIGSEQFAIGISPGRILGGAGDQLLSSTVDVYQFHEYRIEGKAGQNFNVFVDNNPLGTVAPAITNSPQDALYFGDATAGANAQVDIASYSFTQ